MDLNLRDRLNVKRRDTWDECQMQIAEYCSAHVTQGAQALKQVLQAKVTSELKRKIAYEAEFSSVAEACIEKNAPEPLKRSIFEMANAEAGN